MRNTWILVKAARDDAGRVRVHKLPDGRLTVTAAEPLIIHPCYVEYAEKAAAGAWTGPVPWSTARKGRRPRRAVSGPVLLPLPADVALDSEEAMPEESGIVIDATLPEPSPVVGERIETARAALTGTRRIAGSIPLHKAAPGVSTVAKLPSAASLIPKDEREAWDRYALALTCDTVPLRVFVYGPPGTGKTETPFRVAQERGWSHVYQLMTEETPACEILGHYAISGGETVWQDGSLGRALRASQAGHVIYVVDEIGRASADALSACLLALSAPESLRLTLPTGETLSPKPEHWHVASTSNDEPNLLPSPIQDRLVVQIRLDGPNLALVESLTTAEARCLVSSKAREYSIRALIAWDRLVSTGMARGDAAQLVWEPAIAASFLDAARIKATE
jgi:hypothetical protein